MVEWVDWENFSWFKRWGWKLQMACVIPLGRNYGIALIRRVKIRKEPKS